MQKALILLFALVTPVAALAAPVKVGVVHFEKIFDETEASKVDRGELTKLMADKQAQVDQKKVELDRARGQLEAQSAKMDPVARAKREAELDVQASELKKLFEAAQAAVQNRERELSNQVILDAKSLAPEIARARGLQMVLAAAEVLLWTAPEVVQVDLTAEIAHALDAKRGAVRTVSHPR